MGTRPFAVRSRHTSAPLCSLTRLRSAAVAIERCHARSSYALRFGSPQPRRVAARLPQPLSPPHTSCLAVARMAVGSQLWLAMLRRHAKPRPAATRQSPARRRAARFATSRHLTPAAGRADSGRLAAAATAAPRLPRRSLAASPACLPQIRSPPQLAAPPQPRSPPRIAHLPSQQVSWWRQMSSLCRRSLLRLCVLYRGLFGRRSPCGSLPPLAARRGPAHSPRRAAPLAAVASCAAAASLATAQAHRPTYGQMPCAMGDSVGTDGQSLLCGWSQAAVSHGRCPV